MIVGLEGLFASSRGWILADEVNGNEMCWGLTQSNDVKAKVPTQKLCVLAGLECLTTFSGCTKSHYDPVVKIFNERLEQSQPSSVPLLMVQQLYGTPTDHARPSTSTKVRVQTGYAHNPSFRLNAKRRRERFQELVSDNLPKKPRTYDEAVIFGSSVFARNRPRPRDTTPTPGWVWQILVEEIREALGRGQFRLPTL